MRCLVGSGCCLVLLGVVLTLGGGSGCTSCAGMEGMGGPNEMGPDLAGLDLSGVDLSGVDLSGVDQRLPDGCRDSAECPQQVAPICDRGSLPAMCRPCQRHEECRNRHPNLKWCIAGGCHECVSSNDCPNDLGCRAGACVACQVHGECASLVCDPYQRNGAGSHGRCVPQTSLIYVDNRNGGACTPGDGSSPERAVCTLAQGLAALGGSRQALRVMKSTATYGQLHLTSSATVYGPAGGDGSDDKAMLGGDNGRTAVWVESDGTSEPQLILDGFEIIRSARGVQCSGRGGGANMKRPTLRLRRSVVTGGLFGGLQANRCVVEIDRVRFARNGQGGIYLIDFVEYSITNTFVLDNSFGGGGVSFGEAAGLKPDGSPGQAVFRYNTVRGNSPRGVDCGPGDRPLQDSIVIDNAGGTNQFRGTCKLTRVVVGDKETIGEPGAIKQNPMVDAEGRLQAGDTVCVDQGGSAPEVRTDYFGTVRPVRKTMMGSGYDIGAHELP